MCVFLLFYVKLVPQSLSPPQGLEIGGKLWEDKKKRMLIHFLPMNKKILCGSQLKEPRYILALNFGSILVNLAEITTFFPFFPAVSPPLKL